MSLKEAEQFVVKLNQSAVGKINSLIQKSKMNPYTLFILVHDHAHWDISRYVTSYDSLLSLLFAWLLVELCIFIFMTVGSAVEETPAWD